MSEYNYEKYKQEVSQVRDILSAITQYRTERGWSEYQLAEHAGLPQTTISSWYRKNALPSLSSLEKICVAFDISMSQLFAEDGDLVSLTPAQKNLLESWARLSPEQQDLFSKLINSL